MGFLGKVIKPLDERRGGKICGCMRWQGDSCHVHVVPTLEGGMVVHK